MFASLTREELIVVAEDQSREIRQLHDKLEAVHYRLQQAARRAFGPRSETDVPGQERLDLPDLLPDDEGAPAAEADDIVDGDDHAAAGSASDPSPSPAATGNAKRPPRQRGGRLRVPEHIERRDIVLEPDAADLVDEDGRPLPKLRENISERLQYVAGHFVLTRIIRPVHGRRDADQPGVQATPPPQIVSGGLAGDSLLATILCDKFDLHNPCYRQQDRLARAGISIPRSSMVNWIGATTDFLAGVVEAIADEVRAAPWIGLDDTTMPRLAPGTGRTHTGRMWGFLGGGTDTDTSNGGAVVIRYADDRRGQHAADFLDSWTGPIVADHYAGHETLYQGGCTHVPCWAHVRRKFVDAYRDGGDQRAGPIIGLIGRLYALEKELRKHPPDERRRQRQHIAAPTIAEIEAQLDHLDRQTTPKSPLGQAVRYALNLRDRLSAYLADGRLPIDNNALERLWKPVALGRKNYLFVGNEAGGERAAAAYTLMLSCRLAGIEPYAYLMAAIAAHHAGSTDDADWTPQAYAARRGRSALTHRPRNDTAA